MEHDLSKGGSQRYVVTLNGTKEYLSTGEQMTICSFTSNCFTFVKYLVFTAFVYVPISGVTCLLKGPFIQKPYPVLSGMPQRSVLVSLRFVLNDICSFIRASRLFIFADDLKLFAQIWGPLTVSFKPSNLIFGLFQIF